MLLGFQDLNVAEAVWDGGEPCSGGTQALNLLPDFRGSPDHQGCLEGLIGLLLHFVVRGTSTADAVLVVL